MLTAVKIFVIGPIKVIPQQKKELSDNFFSLSLNAPCQCLFRKI